MDFGLSDEQREFKALCHRFATEVIRPVAAKHDIEESTPWEVIKAARQWGLHGIDSLQRLGSDPDGQFSVIYAEELHWGCAGIALAISGSSLAAAGLASSGTPEQIAKWVPECFGLGEEIRLGAYAVTEPQAGSDVKSLRTTAKLDGDEWTLNGTKVFITNGGIADVHVVVATVDPELGHRGQASFVIPKGTPGLEQGKKESKLGIRASHTAEVILEDCRVPVENLLGGMDKLERRLKRARSGESTGRASNALATFELTRPIVGASALGIAQAAYEWTLAYLGNGGTADPVEEYLDESSTAGRRPLERQGIQQRLGNVATEIEAARLLVQRASWMGRNGIPMTGGQGSMSKLKGGDVAMWATRSCMDLVGPYAQSTDCPLEKWFRDAKIYQLFEGTAEIQRLVISRMQAAEYHERLANGVEVAADAIASAQSGNGAGPSGDRRDDPAAADGNGRAPAADRDRLVATEQENGAGRSVERTPNTA
jgi:acyl-CoA dehydrogenase